MATMREIVTRAFRKAGIGASGEDLEAEYLADGIVSLNAMLHEWKLRGVDLSHSDLKPENDFPIGPEFELGTTYMLAEQISPDFTSPKSFNADDFFRAIQAAYVVIDEVTLPLALTELPSELVRNRTYGYD